MKNTKTLVIMSNKYLLTPKQAEQWHDQNVRIAYVGDLSSLREKHKNMESVDALLIDGDGMPSGLNELVTEIRAYQAKPPLLIYASGFRLSAMALALQAGFDEFMSKPIDQEALMTLIKNKTCDKK